MKGIKLCGLIAGGNGTIVNDKAKNPSGKHGIRTTPHGNVVLVQYGLRDLTLNPLSARETEVRQTFKTASELRSMILNDSALKATWAQRFKLDTVTNCVTLSGYIQSMAAKGHIDSDGSYK